MVDNQLGKVIDMSRQELFLPKNKRECGVAFVVTYAPCLRYVGKVLRKHLPVLYTDSRVREVFTPAPFVSYRTGQNLRSHLVRSKVQPLDRHKGSRGCKGIKCEVCDNVQNRDSFISTRTQEEFLINHALNCNSTNVIYLLTCKICSIQYVGQTLPKFRSRWNNYKADAKRCRLKTGKVMQRLLHEHFLQEDHNGFLKDCQVTLIDKTDHTCPKQRENFWIRLLDTMHPHGLNIEEKV